MIMSFIQKNPPFSWLVSEDVSVTTTVVEESKIISLQKNECLCDSLINRKNEVAGRICEFCQSVIDELEFSSDVLQCENAEKHFFTNVNLPESLRTEVSKKMKWIKQSLKFDFLSLQESDEAEPLGLIMDVWRSGDVILSEHWMYDDWEASAR